MTFKFTDNRRINQFDVLFVTNVGPTIGLGHLTRMLAVAQALKVQNFEDFHFLIFGEKIKSSELEGIDCEFIEGEIDFSYKLLKIVNRTPPKVIVFDLHPQFINSNFENIIAKLLELKIYSVGVDSLYPFAERLNITWIPSFQKPLSFISNTPVSLKFGWDTYLIQKRLPTPKWSKGNKVLILTGGSDYSGLGKMLPQKLENQLPHESEIHWVQGPFALAPNLPAKPRLKWFVHEKPENLDALIVNSNYALTVFGVSFFELLQYGIPTVVFSPYNGKDDDELQALKKENVAIIAENDDKAVNGLTNLMQNEELAISLSQKAKSILSVNGAKNLANSIISLLDN
jgi:spore coat polysaccharide biosynthesis predicted glycosyltransferase SpsG